MSTDNKDERVYLDWAAASPLLPAAFVAMKPYLMGDFGNASAIHQEGVVARQAIDKAREAVARSLQVRPEFVTFTGGGTEGNNLAILGTVETLYKVGRAYTDMAVVTTRIEHPSVLRVMDRLQALGVQVDYVVVDEFGSVQLEQLKELLTEKTVLVSVAYANSEIGVVQPVHGIRKILSEAEEKFSSTILFHVDAAQAPLWLSCQFNTIGADFLVLDAAKCCGPKGVGVLVRSKRSKLVSVAYGGGQEQGLRPGTENVAGIVGAGVAIEAAQSTWRERAEQIRTVRDEAIKYLQATITQAVLNGPSPASKNRIANNINISILGLDTEFTTIVLDSKGFAVSTKSACSGAGGGESVVVKETTKDPARAASTLRVTIGPDTTIEQLKKLVDTLEVHVDKTLLTER